MADDKAKKYWQTLAERSRDGAATAANEFAEELPVGEALEAPIVIGKGTGEGDPWSRRGFFKAMGLSAAAAAAACSRAPVQKAIPFLVKPEEIVPGVPLWYATSCGACTAGCGLLAKTRDGRPIKLEGNDTHPADGGGVCALGQASILALYDAARARGPSAGGKPTSWAELDAAVASGLAQAQSAGKAIRVVLPEIAGPAAEAALSRFLAAFPAAKAVRHDPLGEVRALGDAHRVTHGVRALPAFRLQRARVIVSLGADFLGTWVNPVALSRQWRQGREPEKKAMSRHFQVEPVMTLTGSNADRRLVAAASDQLPVLAAVAKRVLAHAGHPASAAILGALVKIPAPELPAKAIDELAEALLGAKGAAVVLCGGTDLAAHALTNAVNDALGAYGTTLDLAGGIALDEKALSFEDFAAELEKGQVGAAVLLQTNPVYDHPQGAKLGELLAKVATTVVLSDRLDETASLARHHAASHHFLEAWGDTQPRRDVVGLRQPAVAPLFDTREPFESLLRWAGEPGSWYDFLRLRWSAEVMPRARALATSFESFWDRSVQDGFAELQPSAPPAPVLAAEATAAAIAAPPPKTGDGDLELVLHAQVGLRDGSLGNAAWLHELPDPITKNTWGNVAAIAPALAAKLGLADGDHVSVSTASGKVTLPVLVQPGQHPRAVAVGLGHGRTHAGPVGNGVGVNAFALGAVSQGRVALAVKGRLAAAGGKTELPLTQVEQGDHHREDVKEVELAAFLASPAAGNEDGHEVQPNLWGAHEYKGHRWGMAIDLTACTGCSACLVSCQAENNVAVVGADEVRRRREMHWIRIDRYYEGSPDDPKVVHQPMMCQHCENAPCETVCPVLATMHSSEGLNQQIYNRCVGTRYCANNCPPKVRRFNWWENPHDDPLERMVLNPDVAVRSRGVMEKCSLCVQRIQEGKVRAKAEGRELQDGDIRTACEQSCPTKAITFGDLNDPKGALAKRVADERSYRVLAEVNIGPSIHYLTRIRNSGGRSGNHE